MSGAAEGDVIVLAAGDYPISSTVSIANGVTVRGAGIDKTILRATKAKVRILYMNDANATAEDMTITDAFHYNENWNGAAISVGGKGGSLTRVRVTHCGQDNCVGGVVYINGSARVSHCIFDRNRIRDTGGGGTYGGIVRVEAAVTFDNCLFCCNTNNGYNATLRLTGGASVVRNCTIVNNHGYGTAGGLSIQHSGVRIYNTVVALNTLDLSPTTYSPNVSLNDDSWANSCLQYCAFSDVKCGSHPQLVTAADFPKAARGKYRPTVTSACVDNGTLSCWGDLTGVVDVEGCPRLQHKKIDIGAYEVSFGGFTLIVR